MKYVDNFLNGITMYKLVLYGLFVLAGIAVFLGFISVLPYSGLSLLFSFLLLAVVCYLTNYIIGTLLKVQTNVESASISSLILFFILFPLSSTSDIWIFVVAGVVAMASKYILAIHKKHIFNPVAISVFLLGLFGVAVESWWIGSSVMLVPVVVLGLLLLRKVQRLQLFLSFFVGAVVTILVVGLSRGSDLHQILMTAFLSGPILFFGLIMLTEPLTTPPSKKMQIVYGLLVGVLFGSQFHIGLLYSTPALALIIGNLFSYFVSPRARLVLTLAKKDKLSADVYDFIWKTDQSFTFKAGQYLEWTLGHGRPDARGNRRYFTIASSPTEQELHLGVKFYPDSSSFKTKLLSLEPGNQIIASQLSGEFTLPNDPKKKLVFIAGGIGITPFRSMIKYLLDSGERREVTLLFSNRTPSDIVYRDIFESAEEKIGIKTLYVVGSLAGATLERNMRVGSISADMIMKEVPDYLDCFYYVSGPPSMVSSFRGALASMGISRSHVKTDFFPGYL